jgi:hypothetical protein
MGFLPFVEFFVLEAFQEDLSTIISLFKLADLQAIFAMLSFCCPTTDLLIAYCMSITKYLIVLFRTWCLYHNYFREVIRVKIL